MDFRDPEFLIGHIRSILTFYEPVAVDAQYGGYVQNLEDDGTVFDPQCKHLVSSTRLIFNYATAYRLFGEPRYRDLAEHGLRFLAQGHRRDDHEGYHWRLEGRRPIDSTNHCYGLAFVLLAYSAASAAGIEGARRGVDATVDLLERRFWQPEAGVYADEASPDWSQLSPYRGQNANMHACEALLAAFEATGERAYLQRARALARRITVELTAQTDGLVWEHFREDLSVDWDYNRNDPANLYRPWGFQPGHQTEWAKLLMILHHHAPEDWMLERACALFDRAVEMAWDHEFGGLAYSVAPGGEVCDDDKYFWVQAESIAAAAWLGRVSGQSSYLAWYDRLWGYCWAHFVDHRHGAWFRLLSRDNRKRSTHKSIAGAKCDYHSLGACVEALRALGTSVP